MSYRAKPKYATRNARAGAWTTCDTCGLIWSQSAMAFQYDFMGGYLPENRRLLRCPKCIDALMYQRKLIIIPPDPPPIYNTRPEPYGIDEGNFLTTQGAHLILTDESGNPIITQIPNPVDVGFTAHLFATVDCSRDPALAHLYVDFYAPEPPGGTSGPSILPTMTGATVRTDLFSLLTRVNVDDTTSYLTNSQTIVLTASAPGPTNINTIAFYDAPTGGNLLGSAPIAYRGPPGAVMKGMQVQFDAIDLAVLIFGTTDMITQAGIIMITEGTSDFMITEH